MVRLTRTGRHPDNLFSANRETMPYAGWTYSRLIRYVGRAGMSGISRREFFKYTATSAAAASLLSAGTLELHANPLGMPIGCQTWPVRTMIAHDFPGTIKQLAAAGFQSIELCSPVGYADSGFAGLAKYAPAGLKKILSDAGVTCISSHFGIDELRKDQPGRIAWAKDVGLTQMLVPSLGGPKNPAMD